jgi:hypothetical protein
MAIQRFVFRVVVEVERTNGKFASRDEIAEAIVSELEGAEPSTLDGIGSDSDSTYDVQSFEISDVSADEPKPKRTSRRKLRAAIAAAKTDPAYSPEALVASVETKSSTDVAAEISRRVNARVDAALRNGASPEQAQKIAGAEFRGETELLPGEAEPEPLCDRCDRVGSECGCEPSGSFSGRTELSEPKPDGIETRDHLRHVAAGKLDGSCHDCAMLVPIEEISLGDGADEDGDESFFLVRGK